MIMLSTALCLCLIMNLFRQGNKNNFAELNKRIELLEKKVKRLEMFNEALAKKAKEISLNEKKKNSHNKKNN